MSQWDMTLADALARQASQIEWYGHRYPGGTDALRSRMASLTHTDGLDLTAMRDITAVNRLVPRGWDIEQMLSPPVPLSPPEPERFPWLTVYRVHCRTYALAGQLDRRDAHPSGLAQFRARPAYRSVHAIALRARVAALVRQSRAASPT
jgi:hypothetical protein